MNIAIEILTEAVKSVIRESFRYGYNKTDSLSAGILHLIQSPSMINFYRNRRERYVTQNAKTHYVQCVKCKSQIKEPENKIEDCLAQAFFDDSIEEFKDLHKRQQGHSLIGKPRRLSSSLTRDEKRRLSHLVYSQGSGSVVSGLIKRLGKSLLAMLTMLVPLLLSFTKAELEQKNNYHEMELKLVADRNTLVSSSQECFHKYYFIEQASVKTERYTTGFFEDLELRLCLSVDRASVCAKTLMDDSLRLIHRFNRHLRMEELNFSSVKRNASRLLSFSKAAIRKLHYRSLMQFIPFSLKFTSDILKEKTMERLKKVVSHNQSELKQLFTAKTRKCPMWMQIKMLGYPSQTFDVLTDDGYILEMVRINRANSNNVLILQHGICDSPYIWIANGCTDSLAFRAWDCGFDVFMTTFRGVLPRRKLGGSMSNYWDFSVNELALYDFPAGVRKIREIKRKELSLTDFKNMVITFTGHSMGGMVLLMYLIHSRMSGIPHHLSRAILLSPAGIHTNSSLINRSLDYFCGSLLRHITKKIVLPEFIANFILKLVEDMHQIPSLKSLASFIGSRILGGTSDSELSPVSLSSRLFYNLISYGFSTKLVGHFYQLILSQTFEAFNDGKEKNLELYEQARPMNFLEKFGLIDIPIHFVASLNDNLIRAGDVYTMYKALADIHPELAEIKLFEGFGHIEFTYLSHFLIMETVMQILVPSFNRDRAPSQADHNPSNCL